MTVRSAVFETVPNVDVITTLVFVVTGVVVIEKVLDVAPGDTVTNDTSGLATVGFELDNTTVTPPAGAGDDSVTVPIGDPEPPLTVLGLIPSF